MNERKKSMGDDVSDLSGSMTSKSVSKNHSGSAAAINKISDS